MESQRRRGSLVHTWDARTLDRSAAGRRQEDGFEDSCELSETTGYWVFVLLLLQLTPNLARSRFHLPDHASSTTLALSDTSLKFLKGLALVDHGFLLDQAAPIIRLAPNLEILHCDDCAEVTSDFLGHKTLDGTPLLQNLTELSLTNSNITAASLNNLLAAVGASLTKFNIRPRTRGVTTISDDVEFDEALVALRPWRQTLRELSFLFTSGIQLSRRRTGVSILREFRAVQILRAEAAFFDFYRRRDALSSTLPPSLRELRLRGYSNLGPALWGLLEVFLIGTFPELSRIEIDDQEFEFESEAALELRQVAAAFLSAGVDFIVLPVRSSS